MPAEANSWATRTPTRAGVPQEPGDHPATPTSLTRGWRVPTQNLGPLLACPHSGVPTPVCWALGNSGAAPRDPTVTTGFADQPALEVVRGQASPLEGRGSGEGSWLSEGWAEPWKQDGAGTDLGMPLPNLVGCCPQSRPRQAGPHHGRVALRGQRAHPSHRLGDPLRCGGQHREPLSFWAPPPAARTSSQGLQGWGQRGRAVSKAGVPELRGARLSPGPGHSSRQRGSGHGRPSPTQQAGGPQGRPAGVHADGSQGHTRGKRAPASQVTFADSLWSLPSLVCKRGPSPPPCSFGGHKSSPGPRPFPQTEPGH